MPLDMSDIEAELAKDPPGWPPKKPKSAWPELIAPALFFAALLACAASFLYLLGLVCRFIRPLL